VHNTRRQRALSPPVFDAEKVATALFPVSPSPGGAQVREFILIV
jgi:hypothetical protein